MDYYKRLAMLRITLWNWINDPIDDFDKFYVKNIARNTDLGFGKESTLKKLEELGFIIDENGFPEKITK